MTDLFDKPTGRDLAEKGITESHEHAENVDPEWSRLAVERFREYAKINDVFMTEDVREWSYKAGFPAPPNEGAWGWVARAAASAGIMHRDGTREAKSPGQHGKPMALWRSGPEIVTGKRVTLREAVAMAVELEAAAKHMRGEGRGPFAAQLTDAARMLRLGGW
jgi:hypothetical protein